MAEADCVVREPKVEVVCDFARTSKQTGLGGGKLVDRGVINGVVRIALYDPFRCPKS